MNKFFSRIMMTGIVAAGAMFAAPINEITVTLPHAVTVGSTTLPGGTYTMSPMEMSDGAEYFVVRGAKTEPLILSAQKSEDEAAAKKTEVSFSEAGGTWHFGKLSIEGEKTSYELGEN
jgi:hypothetical protein